MCTGEGHDYSSDWWSFGILTYELLIGIPPFFDKNKQTMYRNIVT
jgi:serum/glucocorticoid-regulated kinase 2